jgi:isoleucyl-tRNA synthetase
MILNMFLNDKENFNLPKLEEKILKFWQENQIFEKSLEQRKNSKPYYFFEGPPTANGRPHIGHLEGRFFKDIILRYKTMRGYRVRRKAGWDTQGLPVEIEVEKELGFKNKQDIEKFGIAEFNEKCKASLWKYKDEWEKITSRAAFWIDLKNSYATYHNDYLESLWWVLKKISDRKLLARSFKVVPWCPRCQTSLSSHEMGQPGVYKKVKDPSIYIKFPLKNSGKIGKNKNKEYLLVWTTTPWTLPANVAVAVNPKLIYTKFAVKDEASPKEKTEYLWSYNPPPAKEGFKIEATDKIPGTKLIGLKYEPLFDVASAKKEKSFFKVKSADFVETAEGTGLVHIAPAFGADDFNLIKKEVKDLAKKAPITINEKGIVSKGFPGAGKFVKQADKDIIEDLNKRNLLYYSGIIEHEYPHCWRCGTPLLYFAKFSWFIETTKIKNNLLKNNEKINWVPEHIKEGRFGEWLNNNVDWALSRDRYWGTPLPVWQCEKCGHHEIIGGLEDLNKLRFTKNNFWILRHGEADHIKTGTIASGTETKTNTSHLTEKGKKQIAASSEKLIKQLDGKKLAVIFTSPYARARETAKIVAKKTRTKIIADKRLAELNVGDFNGRLVSDFHKAFPDISKRFSDAPAGGENLTDVKKRVMDFIMEIAAKYDGKNILICGHGDPLWMLEGAAAGLENEKITKLKYIEVAELRKINFNNYPFNYLTGNLDLHKPYIDSVYLKCAKCGSKMTRVKEVADVWFDSGCMPFAQNHYPFGFDVKKINELDIKTIQNKIDFPADYISEGMDQTRGWFYSLLAISTALGLGPAYKNVVVQGLVLDKNGIKMSKSKGNTVDPWDMINKYGVDVLRWYFYTINQPSDYKKFDEADLGKTYRRFIAIIFNSFLFLEMYGAKGKELDKKIKLNILDRWILAKLNNVITEVTNSLEKYDIVAASKSIENFVDNLSRWYIRRSRRRFQKSDSQSDLETASIVLRNCLSGLSKISAPFTPFFSEALYKSLNTGNSNLSVHLEEWPKTFPEFSDDELINKMEEIIKISGLALAERAKSGIKVRQPLKSLTIKSPILSGKTELLEILKDEINVKEIIFDDKIKSDVELDTVITTELKEEGFIRELTRIVQELRQKADYKPKDKIKTALELPEELKIVIQKNEKVFVKEVGAEELIYKKTEKFEAEIQTKIQNSDIWVGIIKI